MLQKLFKGGNYSRKYGKYNFELLVLSRQNTFHSCASQQKTAYVISRNYERSLKITTIVNKTKEMEIDRKMSLDLF